MIKMGGSAAQNMVQSDASNHVHLEIPTSRVSVATVWFSSFFHFFISFFVIENAGINVTINNTKNGNKHSPTSYLLNKLKFIQIHAANLEILKE
jgi:hypothetical protein